MRKDKGAAGDEAAEMLGRSEPGKISRRSSIRTRIFARVLPVVVLPLIFLGAVAIASITVIQTRTSEAVDTAEAVLTAEVVEDAVNRSADGAARELGRYVNSWVDETEDLATRREVGLAIAEGNDALAELRLDETTTNESLRAALSGQRPLVDTLFIESLAEELTDPWGEPDILLVSRNGVHLASSSGQIPTVYREEQWFRHAMQDGSSIRSFVNEEGSPSSIEVAFRSWVFGPSNVVGVVRIRIPIVAIQAQLDEIVADAAVDGFILDRSGPTSVLLANTTNNHDPELLYQPNNVMEGLDFDLELMAAGTVEDDEFLTAARTFESVGGAAENDVGWIIVTRQPIDLATAPLQQIREVSADAGQTKDIVTFGVLALTLLAMYIGYRSARITADRITMPLEHLSNQAQAAANDGIPAVVEAARNSEEKLPELDSFEVETKDELSVLANSLNVMQDAAVQLAAGQATLRRQNVAHTFVSLGRRNQNLLNRQLEFIDELERAEDDPDTLQNLFRLDHLATRMRRNAENLLVLAGEQTPRRWAKPIAIRDVLQAAASEVADYQRVRMGEIDPATVSGNLATDLSHLLAELLDNAGAFSPPESPIDILGQRTSSHYRLAIIDQGIGMDERALEEANHRLANPVDFADAPSAYLGLFVVGHLAKQLNITVRLANSEPVNIGNGSTGGGGTIAFIDLPNAVLSSEAPSRIDVAPRASVQKPEADPPSEPAAPDLSSAPGALPPTEIIPSPEPAVTAAGFPKRVAPMVAKRSDLPETTAAGFPKRHGPSPTEPSAPPPMPAPEPAVTAAGFPKRKSPGVAAEPSPSVSDPSTVPARSAESISSSLSSFRDAVAKGRAEASTAQPPLPPPMPDRQEPLE